MNIDYTLNKPVTIEQLKSMGFIVKPYQNNDSIITTWIVENNEGNRLQINGIDEDTEDIYDTPIYHFSGSPWYGSINIIKKICDNLDIAYTEG